MKKLAWALACTLGFAAAPQLVLASSHGEAPFIKGHPRLDNTDFYVFRSYETGRDGFVTFIANFIPLQDSYGGPNYFTFDPSAIYEIHVDNDGDNAEDITFQFKFNNTLGGTDGSGLTLQIGDTGAEETIAVPLKNIGGVDGTAGDDGTLNSRETYTIHKVDGDRRSGTRTQMTKSDLTNDFEKPYDFVGDKTFGGNYAGYANQHIHDVVIPGCSDGKVFVGQRQEGFAVNLGPIFDLVNMVPIEGGEGGFPSGITQSVNNDDLYYKDITSIALEVPIDCLTDGTETVIGAWSTSSIPQARLMDPSPTFGDNAVHGGAYVQVSRLGMPLVNEVVIGIPDKDLFNASEPKDDGQFAAYVTHPSLPVLLNVLFLEPVNTLLDPDTDTFTYLEPREYPRDDLVTTFLTGFAGVNANGGVSEMVRLNTATAVTAAGAQENLGVAAGDLAGFPNGRRPGDDIVDIALRVVMGALCDDIPGVGNLGLCDTSLAPTSGVAYTDGAPVSDADFDTTFPYLRSPDAR